MKRRLIKFPKLHSGLTIGWYEIINGAASFNVIATVGKDLGLNYRQRRALDGLCEMMADAYDTGTFFVWDSHPYVSAFGTDEIDPRQIELCYLHHLRTLGIDRKSVVWHHAQVGDPGDSMSDAMTSGGTP